MSALPMHSKQNCQELKRERRRESLLIWILHESALSTDTDHGRGGVRERERESAREEELASEKESERAKDKESERCSKCQAIYIHVFSPETPAIKWPKRKKQHKFVLAFMAKKLLHRSTCAHARAHIYFYGECGVHFNRCCEHHACAGVYVRRVL